MKDHNNIQIETNQNPKNVHIQKKSKNCNVIPIKLSMLILKKIIAYLVRKKSQGIHFMITEHSTFDNIFK